MKKLIQFVSIILITLNLAQAKTIRFATDANYLPFEYIDASGQIKGFDIDIVNALCQQMKVQCSMNSQSFSSLIPSLNLGKFDAIIGSIGITPEREKQVSFTHSYYTPSASFVAAIANHYTINQLVGKTIGVQSGSTFESYLSEHYQNKVNVKTYLTIQDAFLDLKAGRVDAVLADTAIVQTWLNQNTNKQKFVIVEKPIVNNQYFGLGYGIAVRKSNTELLNALNKALEEIKKNGTYHSIVKKYFGDNT